ncbi:MAG: hypothetical protein AABM31_03950 [Actinomycetota bacterium]
MNARRIEIGPLAVLAGSVLLLVSLFLDWYELQPGAGFTAFTVFEFLDIVLASLALAGGAGALGRVLRGAADGPGDRALDRVAPGVAIAALILVLSQVFNHPPAAVGDDALSGQWLALGGASLMTAGAVLDAARISFAVNVSPRERSTRRERPVAAQPPVATEPVVAPPVSDEPPAEEARVAETEVKEELYPDTERHGPIGAWDPETAGQETQAMDAPSPAGDEDPTSGRTGEPDRHEDDEPPAAAGR